MKQLTIWTRRVSTRRSGGYFGEAEEIIAKYGDRFVVGSEEELNNPRLRVPFRLSASTRSEKRYEALRASCVTKKGTWKKDNKTALYRPLFEAVDKDTNRPESKAKQALRDELEALKEELHRARSQAGQTRRSGDKEGAKSFEKETVWPLEKKEYELKEAIRQLAD